MDKSQIDKLLAELQKDEKFRTEFLKDAVGTLKSKNYMLTAEQETKLKNINLSDLKNKLGAGLKEGCTYHAC
jgi:hypothetical protein